MNSLFTLLKWDTKTFGYKIAKIIIREKDLNNIENIKVQLNNSGIKLAYWFIEAENELMNEWAIKLGGKLVDEKNTYKKEIDFYEVDIKSDKVKDFGDEIIPQKLYDLAIQASIYSRYRLDTNFKNNEYLTLYSKWLENSINKTIATDVLVYRENNDLQGLLTVDVKKSQGTIGLLSVDEQSRGKSIGTKLMKGCFSKMRDYNVKDLFVKTQKNNHAACRFYESMGFILFDTINIYHLWI